MAALCTVLLFLAPAPPDLTVEQFKEQYKKAHDAAAAVYSKLHVKETRTQPNGQVQKREAWLNGDYLKVIIQAQQIGTVMEYMTRTKTLKLQRKDDNQPWVFQETLPLAHDKAFQVQRDIMMGTVPETFRQPFRVDQRQSLMDALDGKSRLGGGGGGPAISIQKKNEPVRTTKVTKVETVGTGDAVKYRVHFEHLLNDQLNARSYVEVDPKQAWLITKGWSQGVSALNGVSWTIEYGDPINGVPIMKKLTSQRVTRDEKTGAETPAGDANPTVVTVDLAEPYEHVNESEFTPAFYQVEVPEMFDPFKKEETPKELYYAIAGVAGLFLLLLILHFSRKKARPPEAATPSPAAPLS